MVEEVGINYRIEKENIDLELKAILDTGCESIIGAEDRLGKIITDGGKDITVRSVINKRKSYKAREIEGWLDSGPAQILICQQISKPEKSSVLMKNTRGILGLKVN